RSFILNNEEYSIGDTIFVSRQEVISAPPDISNCYIAQITDLYEKELIYSKVEVQKFAKVRWYWQESEVPKPLRKLLSSLTMAKNEVILDLTNSFEQEIDLETVMGKCKVLHIADNAPLSPEFKKEDNNNSYPTFFARRAYKGKSFVYLTGKENEELFTSEVPATPDNNGKRRGSAKQDFITPNGNSRFLSEGGATPKKSSSIKKSVATLFTPTDRKGAIQKDTSFKDVIKGVLSGFESPQRATLKPSKLTMERLNQKDVVDLINRGSDDESNHSGSNANSDIETTDDDSEGGQEQGTSGKDGSHSGSRTLKISMLNKRWRETDDNAELTKESVNMKRQKMDISDDGEENRATKVKKWNRHINNKKLKIKKSSDGINFLPVIKL
ncbi:unnamed protein product, partial [Lymnaea stagnalis]